MPEKRKMKLVGGACAINDSRPHESEAVETAFPADAMSKSRVCVHCGCFFQATAEQPVLEEENKPRTHVRGMYEVDGKSRFMTVPVASTADEILAKLPDDIIENTGEGWHDESPGVKISRNRKDYVVEVRLGYTSNYTWTQAPTLLEALQLGYAEWFIRKRVRGNIGAVDLCFIDKEQGA